MFFDSSYGDIKKSAIDKLVGIGRAKQIVSGPLEIMGVGDQKSFSDDGFYSVCLALHTGSNVVLGGLGRPEITAQFPIYDLRVVEKDLQSRCRKVCGLEVAKHLPRHKICKVLSKNCFRMSNWVRYLRVPVVLEV